MSREDEYTNTEGGITICPTCRSFHLTCNRKQQAKVDALAEALRGIAYPSGLGTVGASYAMGRSKGHEDAAIIARAALKAAGLEVK